MACKSLIIKKNPIVSINPGIKSNKIVVIVCLYYEETLNYYFEYIKNIPETIKVVIVSSKSEIKKYIPDCIKKRQYFEFIKKNNQGRDISSLLVTCKDIVQKSDICCFIHDKKSHFKRTEEDVDIWMKATWNNLLGSKNLIINIIYELENSKVGMFFPPKPAGKYINVWYTDAWGKNYKNVCDLAKKLQIRTPIIEEEQPDSIGTAFWCKSIILKKLLDLNWKYSDFPQEPMPNDGTISHSIERIFQYLCLDAGYEYRVVMNDEYAAEFLDTIQKNAYETFLSLNQEFGIATKRELDMYDINLKNIRDAIEHSVEVYIYGAGYFGKKIEKILVNNSIDYNGFVVSQIDDNSQNNVLELKDIKNKNALFIIAVSYEAQAEIINLLKTKGFNNYIPYLM